MKAIILAAGEGTRLRPYTKDVPKCMVPFRKTPIIDYILAAFEGVGVNDIIVVNGYKKEVLESHLENRKIKFVNNRKYGQTNMVYTLFCAEKEMDDDIIISYSDIIFKSNILQALIESTADFSVVVDKQWRELWELRMENPLSDAETMKLDSQGNIVELGKKAHAYTDIDGQYIGLIKISKKVVNTIIKHYYSLDKSIVYDGKNFNNMYMTSFIQSIIDNLMPVKALFINGGWVEIDSTEDLKIYENTKNLIF